MIFRQKCRFGIVVAVGLAGLGIGGCSSSGGSGGSGSGGSGTGGQQQGTGGVTSTGGKSGSGGTVGSGGSTASGGTVGSGGATATGGTVGTGGATASGGSQGTGGTSSNGGAAAGGTTVSGSGGTEIGGGGGRAMGSGGSAAGGRGNGGRNGSGGMAMGSGGAGGTPPSGSCEKGMTKGSDVAILGESFYAISPQYIQNRIQDDARKAGSLGASDTYHNVAVSGQNMNYIATTEWTAATQGGAAPKFVIMDGGGIDCLNGSSCPTCASTFTMLLGKMGTAGVKKVIYTRYPEPGNPPGSNTALKACLDMTMPGMQTACAASTSPQCDFLDLRPVWVNGDTSDGLHPTQSGGEHVGDLIWSEMMKDCIAQ